jgi:hypothetical protein
LEFKDMHDAMVMQKRKITNKILIGDFPGSLHPRPKPEKKRERGEKKKRGEVPPLLVSRPKPRERREKRKKGAGVKKRAVP